LNLYLPFLLGALALLGEFPWKIIMLKEIMGPVCEQKNFGYKFVWFVILPCLSYSSCLRKTKIICYKIRATCISTLSLKDIIFRDSHHHHKWLLFHSCIILPYKGKRMRKMYHRITLYKPGSTIFYGRRTKQKQNAV